MRDPNEDSNRGVDIIAHHSGVLRHVEASIDLDISLSTYQKEPINILSDVGPPHENPNPRVTSEPTAETDAASHVYIKQDSRVISELHNSYDYTRDIEFINLEGHSEHVYAIDGTVPLCDVVSDTHISVSYKYKCINTAATSVKSSLSYQDKEKNSQIHNYCDNSEDIEYKNMRRTL